MAQCHSHGLPWQGKPERAQVSKPFPLFPTTTCNSRAMHESLAEEGSPSERSHYHCWQCQACTSFQWKQMAKLKVPSQQAQTSGWQQLRTWQGRRKDARKTCDAVIASVHQPFTCCSGPLVWLATPGMLTLFLWMYLRNTSAFLRARVQA